MFMRKMCTEFTHSIMVIVNVNSHIDDDAGIFHEEIPDPVSVLCASLSVAPLTLNGLPKIMRATAGHILLASIAIIIAVPTVCLTEPKNFNTSKTNNSGTDIIDLSSLRWSRKATRTAGVLSEHGSDSRRLSFCIDIIFDSFGSLYIADYENNRIQKKIANSPNSPTVVNQTQISLLTKVAADAVGNIYIAMESK
ncbi:hypothetical protein I4U23_022280 [Adineta vaga]|nr:hypothetical protein I4U23_022280 [Adineta vaga]